jgi:hypothetical protein
METLGHAADSKGGHREQTQYQALFETGEVATPPLQQRQVQGYR